MKYFINFALLISLVFSFGCGKKVFIPVYNNPKEQYEFASEQKERSFIIVDKDKKKAKFDEIIMAFEKVEKQFPNDKEYLPLAKLAIGDCYRHIENYKKAAEVYEDTLTKFGSMEDIKPFALFGAAISYDHIKKYEKSQEYLKFLIDNYSDTTKRPVQEIVEKAKVKYSMIKTR